MKKKKWHQSKLVWIIPLILVVTISIYAFYQQKQNIELDCLNDMDDAIITLQFHCIFDLINNQRNLPFCDEFQNQSKILSLYNWSRK